MESATSLYSSVFGACRLLPFMWYRLKNPSSRVVAIAGGAGRRRDYGQGKLVDENMIVLRMRVQQMKSVEAGEALVPASDWMEWEKRYYVHYNEDVCQAVGLLQRCLATLFLFMLSVPISCAGFMLHVLEMAKGILPVFPPNW